MIIDTLKEQARRHERDEEWRKALDLYLKAIDRLDGAEEPDVSIYNRAADLHVRLGDLDEALKLYDRAIDLYIEADLPNNAIAICRKIGRHVPEEVEIFRRMGQIRALQGFSVDARQNYLTYAEILQNRGQPDEALEALRELVDRIPGDWESRILLAEGLLKRDGQDEAVTQLQAAWIHLMQEGSDPAKADGLRDRILELDPDAILETPATGVGESEWVEGGAPLDADAVEGFETTGRDALDGFESAWHPEAPAEFETEPEAEVESSEDDFDLESWSITEDESRPAEEELVFADDGGETDITPGEDFAAEEALFQEILPETESEPEPGESISSQEPDPVDAELAEGGIGARREEVEESYRTEDRERLIPALLALAEALSEAGDLEADAVFVQLLQLDPGNPRALAALGRSSPFDGPLADLSIDEEAEDQGLEDEEDQDREDQEDQDQERLGEISDAAWMDVEIPEGGEGGGPVDDEREKGTPAAPITDADAGRPAADQEEDPGYVDLGSMILDDSPGERTTRWTVASEEPSGDEGADFARMLSQFKDKVAENLEGEDARSQYDLGTAYKAMGLLDEAISMFQKALRMEPGHLASIEMLGQCFLDRNEPQVAVRVLSRGVMRGGQSPEDELVGIYYFLGQAHEAAGNPDEAREFYEKVFALDINFRDVTDRLRVLR